MSLMVRRASLVDDRQEMLELLNRNFGGGQETRFDWRHHKNPAGEALAWFLCDRNKAVGAVSLFPRRMVIDGRLVLCGQVGGFAIDAGYRSLGPAVLLQRTTFEPVDSGAFAFCYDCPPHDQGMSTFVRLGMAPDCEIIRYALLLRTDEFLQKRLGKGLWTKPLAMMANVFIGRRGSRRSFQGLEISEFAVPFGEEFSQLDTVVPGSGVIRASRSAELLNWRYRENPGTDTTYTLVVRRSGELLAFLALWICSDGSASIVDLFGLELAKTGPALIEAAIEVCRERKLAGVYGFCSNESELKTLFREAGFRPRERLARVVAYENPSGSHHVLNHGLRWTFSHVEEMV